MQLGFYLPLGQILQAFFPGYKKKKEPTKVQILLMGFTDHALVNISKDSNFIAVHRERGR